MAEKLSVKRLLCTKCQEQSQQIEAVEFCINCIEYLCEHCYQDHRTHKATKAPSILHDSLPIDVSVFSHIKDLSNCAIHQQTEVSQYCTNHKTYICYLCKEGKHRTCDRILEISALQTEKKDVLGRIGKTHEKLKAVLDIQRKAAGNLEVERNKIRHEIENFADRLIDEIIQMKENVINELDNATEDEAITICNDLEESSRTEATIKRYHDIVETIDRCNLSTDKTNCLHVLGEKISAIEKLVEYKELRQPAQFHFTPNDMLSLITMLGTVTKDGEAQSEDNHNEYAAQREENISNASLNVNCRTHCVRLIDDNMDCSVVGCTVLNDGRSVVLIDGANKKLKLFNHEFMFVDAVRFNSSPIELCKMDKNKVAVIYKDLKRIDQYSVGNRKLSLWHGLATKYNNVRITGSQTKRQLGLLCKAENTMFGRIQIREYDGMVLTDIGLDCFASPAELSVEEGYICFTADGLMFISRNTGIWCMKSVRNFEDLKIKWKVPLDSRIQSIEHVSCDRNRRLYICSATSKSVYQVDRHHTKIVAADISNPLASAVDPHLDKIMIGCYGDSNVYIFS